MIQKNAIILLIKNEYPSLLITDNEFIPKTEREKTLSKDGKYIPLKTRGRIVSSRKLDTDQERCYLVKFRGFDGYRHVPESFISEIIGATKL